MLHRKAKLCRCLKVMCSDDYDMYIFMTLDILQHKVCFAVSSKSNRLTYLWSSIRAAEVACNLYTNFETLELSLCADQLEPLTSSKPGRVFRF
jgi:hypothetical protein